MAKTAGSIGDSMSLPRSGKLLQFINWRVRVSLSDSRDLVGTFLAFDKHMNLVLAECEEWRKIKGKKGILILLE